MIYFENANIIISWDETEQFVVVERKENLYVEGADFHHDANKGLELVIAHRASKLLCIGESMRVMGRDDQRWFAFDWALRARDSGLKFMGWVKPRSYAAQMSLEAVSVDLGWQGIESVLFDTEEEAREWLRSK